MQKGCHFSIYIYGVPLSCYDGSNYKYPNPRQYDSFRVFNKFAAIISHFELTSSCRLYHTLGFFLIEPFHLIYLYYGIYFIVYSGKRMIWLHEFFTFYNDVKLVCSVNCVLSAKYVNNREVFSFVLPRTWLFLKMKKEKEKKRRKFARIDYMDNSYSNLYYQPFRISSINSSDL